MFPRAESAASEGRRHHVTPFRLEQFYREQLLPGDFDLSASSPSALTSRECYEAAGIKPDLDELPLTYEVGGGSAELRAAVASLYEGVRPEDVLITAGALEAIHAVASAVVETGAPVAIQTPAYGALRQAVVGAGGKPLAWRSPGAFQFRVDDLTVGSLADAQVAFLNTPHGPSGSLLHDAATYPGLLVADEVYRPIELVKGATPRSVLDGHPHSVVIADLSKPLGLGGLRIGWIVCRDRVLLAECAAALDYLSGSVSTLSARVASVALRSLPELLEPRLEAARRNLSRLAAFIELHCDHLDWTPPQAGYTAFLRFRNGPPDQSLFRNLKARGIFLLPGDVFDCPDYVRIGFGGDEAGFRDALSLFSQELDAWPAETHRGERAGDVILFTKAPRKGLAKTRLAAEVGEAMAARLATAFLSDTVAFCRPRARHLFVSYTPADAGNDMAAVAPEATYSAQHGDDFGRRLASAFSEAFEAGARNPVLVGSDSPTLPAHLLDAAHSALLTHDLVVGPAEDGGFYALGMGRPQPQLFEGIDWSTDFVLQQLRENAGRLSLSIFWLPYWYDVDLVQDLRRLYDDPLIGPVTAEVLRSLYCG